jgi:hypothetical protein
MCNSLLNQFFNILKVGIFFRQVLSQAEKERLVDNMGSHLANAQKFIQV